MLECPKCGCEMDADATLCERCGCDVAEATASFEPVGGEGAEEARAEAVDGPVLVVRKGPQPGERFYLDRPTLTIGRDPESDIFLNDMTVSRAHAVLETGAGRVGVRDAGSLNGTYVNGICADSAELRDGDILQVGTFQMVFFSGGDLS